MDEPAERRTISKPREPGLSCPMESPGLPYDHYTVAWICPLPLEQAAARAMLDEHHQPAPRTEGYTQDSNLYFLGTIHTKRGSHHVVIAGLSAGDIGNHPAAEVAYNLKKTFHNVSICLVVGIAGGVPSRKHDIRLGDVVVGEAVMHYERQTVTHGNNIQKSYPMRPPRILLQAVASLRARHESNGSRIYQILKERIARMPKYTRPTLDDKLYSADYIHNTTDDAGPNWETDLSFDPCRNCDIDRIITRKPRSSMVPEIHIGHIASGDALMRCSSVREAMREELEVLCFEMEALGLMRALPCLPVRGISDYSDSHKSDEWQRYAAANAAAYAREILEELQPMPIPIAKGAATVPNKGAISMSTKGDQTRQNRIAEVMAALDFPQRHWRRLVIGETVSDTCTWLYDQPKYLSWLDSSQSCEHRGLLWIKGPPGTGKSTLMRFAYEHHKRRELEKKEKDVNVLITSFFFNARGTELEHSVTGMYRSLLLDVFEHFPELQVLLLEEDLIPPQLTNGLQLPVLQRLFKAAMFRLQQGQVVCYIDAVDECNNDQIEALMMSFQDIARSKVGSTGRFRAFSSCRYYTNVEPELGLILRLDMIPGHREDLETYIKSRLRVDLQELPGLSKLLVHKAQGSFLWLVLVVKTLNDARIRGHGLPNLEELGKKLPRKLDNLFYQIIERDLSSPDHKIIYLIEFKVAVTWILFAMQPLSLEMFYHALESGLAVEGFRTESEVLKEPLPEEKLLERRVLSATKGLAEVKYGRVQFIHESVRTFLTRLNLEKWLPENGFRSPPLCHERLKQYCLWYLRTPSLTAHLGEKEGKVLNTSRINQELDEAFPLAYYCAFWILNHANAAAKRVKQKDFIEGFPEHVWRAIRIEGGRRNMLQHCVEDGLFRIIACGGFEEKVKEKAYLNAQSEDGETSIALAARLGRLSILQKLMSWGADLNLPNHNGDTPLIIAVTMSQYHVAEALIDHNADLHSKNDRGETALHWAARWGLASVTMQLVQKFEQLDIGDRDGSTPLMWAAKHRGSSTAQVLINAGASIDAAQKSGSTALMIAVQRGNLSTVRLLIESGADHSKVNNMGETALSIAQWLSQSESARGSSNPYVVGERDHIVSYLLSKGATAKPNRARL